MAQAKIARRILPYVFLLYIIAYLDRANVAFAKLSMSAALGFSDAVYGFGAGIFFVGYLLLEIPGALIVERWSARKWISRVLISWGVCTVVVGCVRTPGEFYAARFLLGSAEAGFFPGIIVYLTHWFRREDRARAMAGFISAIPVGLAVGAPVSGGILRISWLGIDGWRWLFALEGLPAIVLGFITLRYLTDHPAQAEWLEPREREWIVAELEKEKRALPRGRAAAWRAFSETNVLLLGLALFFANIGVFAFVLWLPATLQRASGFSPALANVLAAIPFAAGVAAALYAGHSSDRSKERRLHTAVPLAGAGLFFTLASLPGQGLPANLLWLSLAAAAIYAFPVPFWVLPTLSLTESAAAAAIGLINSIGNLGGFVGPAVVGYLLAKHYSLTAVCCLAASFVISAALVMAVRVTASAAK